MLSSCIKLYFLRKRRKAKFWSKILVNFYREAIKSTLTGDIRAQRTLKDITQTSNSQFTLLIITHLESLGLRLRWENYF